MTISNKEYVAMRATIYPNNNKNDVAYDILLNIF